MPNSSRKQPPKSQPNSHRWVSHQVSATEDEDSDEEEEEESEISSEGVEELKESPHTSKIWELNKKLKPLDSITLFVIEETLIDDFIYNPSSWTPPV